MIVRSTLLSAIALTALVGFVPPAFADSSVSKADNSVSKSECKGGGGKYAAASDGSLWCIGGSFDGRQVKEYNFDGSTISSDVCEGGGGWVANSSVDGRKQCYGGDFAGRPVR